MKNNIAILGCGNLGIAIAKGLHKSGFIEDKHLLLTRRDLSSLRPLENERIKITKDNKKAVQAAGYVILGIQPAQLDKLLEEIKDVLDPEQHTIISLLTAVRIEELERKIGKDFAIIRAMPNTAIAVLQSMTCIAYNQHAAKKIEEVTALFDCLGQSMLIEERLMQAATVVCASGIAFWMRFIRATTQGGVQLGFDAEDAQKIAVQACLGAASLLAEKETHPESEIDKVTTPQGCTIAGLNEMEHHGLSSALIKGLTTSFSRINDMR